MPLSQVTLRLDGPGAGQADSATTRVSLSPYFLVPSPASVSLATATAACQDLLGLPVWANLHAFPYLQFPWR